MIDRFASPWAFALLALLPALAVWWRVRRPRGVAFSSSSLLSDVPTTWRVRLRGVPVVLLLASLASLVVALARPQKLLGRVPDATEGIAIEIALDRSGSMQEGIDSGDGRSAVSKIDAVKALIHDFLLGNGKDLKGRRDDLVGLVSFARFADTVAPLSRSPEILAKLAQQTRLALVRGEDGTAIGEGLALAAARLRDMDTRAAETERLAPGTAPRIKSKVIILMTDGQNNSGAIDPMQAADLCRQWGLKVYTVGVGAGAGERQVDFGGPFGTMRIPTGGGVDEETLKAIAEATGGRYFAASDARSLREVYATIDALERSKVTSPESTLYQELFTPWAAAGAGAALVSALLRATLFRSLA